MRNNYSRNFLAIFLIIIGITLFFVNIDMIDFDVKGVWHVIYPVFFVVIGFKWMIDYIVARKNSWMLGSFFTIFGSLLLLGQFEIIEFYFADLYKLWPLAIVYLGFSIIGSRKHSKVIVKKSDKNIHKNESYEKPSIEEHKFNTMNWKVTPMELNNSIGNYLVDFSKASIPEEEIPISINIRIGDIRILMPENIEFRVEASALVGDICIMSETSEGLNRSLIYESKNYETATKKLNLNLKVSAGSIRIEKV